MDFPFYRNIKGKLKKRGLPSFKKTGQGDGLNQLLNLAKQLDERGELKTDLCRLAVEDCRSSLSPEQLGESLMIARTLAKTRNNVAPSTEHLKLVVDVYSEALLICDRSFIRPIRLELGRLYESQQMPLEAAECYKQSMCINQCVRNLILAKKYQNALDELKNCPSHLMSSSEYTSMFLLQLLLKDDLDEIKRCSLQHIACISRTSTSRGVIPLDDHLFDLNGLLDSLLIVQSEEEVEPQKGEVKCKKIKDLITNRLYAFLDQPQIELLRMINAGTIVSSNRPETNEVSESEIDIDQKNIEPKSEIDEVCA